MTRFKSDVETRLRQAGWYPGRQVTDQVASWKENLRLSDGIEIFPIAERVLLEFGGLKIDDDGPGLTCAREPFELDPMLAAHEGDRFADFASLINTRLCPVGEGGRGHYFLAIGENGQIYVLMDEIKLKGISIEDALERLILGLQATAISTFGD